MAKLRDLSPKPLAQVLNAFVQVIDDDGALTEGEYALLQGLALLLDCPSRSLRRSPYSGVTRSR